MEKPIINILLTQSRTLETFESSLILSTFFFATKTLSEFIFSIYFCYFITSQFPQYFTFPSQKRHETTRILKPIRDIFDLSWHAWDVALRGQFFSVKVDKKYFMRIFFFIFSPLIFYFNFELVGGILSLCFFVYAMQQLDLYVYR